MRQKRSQLLVDPVLLQAGAERNALHLDGTGDGALGGRTGYDTAAGGGAAVETNDDKDNIKSTS